MVGLEGYELLLRKPISFWHILSIRKTISSSRYSSHLNQLKAALEEKRLELVSRKCKIIHQGNTRPHVSLMTKQELLQLGWEMLIHPP